jgi:hypothetical protein
MIQRWRTLFDKHKPNPPEWEELAKCYGKYEEGTKDAPQSVPAARMLHSRAQKAKEETAGG